MNKPVAVAAAEHWVEALELASLPVGEARGVQHEQHALVLVRLSDAEVCALDARCPEDGLALSKVRPDGSLLSCGRHSFDVRTGKSLRGEEDAAVRPVRLREGKVEVSLGAPDAEAELERRTKSLKEALAAGRLPHAARDIVRLLQAGMDPARIMLEIVAFDALHAESGATHVLPVGVDALRISQRYLAGEAALPLLVPAELALDASKHRSPRRVPPSQDPGREPEQVAARLLQLVEADDPEGADGLMRGALWRKWSEEQIEPGFYELNVAHFLGMGHGLIYTVKAFELLEVVGFEHARRILPGLVYALASMPRDDTLPEWQWFRQRFAQLEPRLAELWSRAGQRTLSDDERRNLTVAMLDGSREEAWHAVIGAWASGGSMDCVLHALSRAAAERWWRFDVAVDRDPSLAEGWLDATHPFTYAHALRAAHRRYQKPGLMKMVLFGVWFVNRQKPLDMPADRWTVVDAKGRASFVDRERFLVDLGDMVRERAPVEAQRAALAYLGQGGALDALRATLYDLVVKDRFTRPTFRGHGVKLVVAACDEAMILPERERTWPIRALVRMLASEVREHSLEALMLGARRRVEQGLEPKTRL